MTSFRAAILVALFSILLASCGETFRPIAAVVPQTPTAGQGLKTVFVLQADSTVHKFNLAGATETGIVTVGQGPAVLAVTALSGRSYVSNELADTLTNFSTQSPQSGTSTVTLPTGSDPGAIEAIPVVSSVYVVYRGLDAVGVIDAASNAQKAQITVGTDPVALISVNGRKLYVANFGSNNVTAIDVTTNAVTNTIDFGGASNCINPSSLAAKPDGTYVYVVCTGSNKLYWINTSNDSYTDVPPATLGSSPNFVTYDVKRNRLVVTNQGSDSISVINEDATTPPATWHSVTNVAVGAMPKHAAALPDGTRIYVANTGSTFVTVVDSAAFTTKTLDVGGNPQQVGASADNLRVAVSVVGSPSHISSIDTTTDTVANTFNLTANPVYMVVTAQ
jgi:YVTN family beta-propeller protein